MAFGARVLRRRTQLGRSRLGRGDTVALRVMVLVSTFVLLLFGDVHVAAVSKAGYYHLTPLLPNVLFALTLTLDVAFEYRLHEAERSGRKTAAATAAQSEPAGVTVEA